MKITKKFMFISSILSSFFCSSCSLTYDYIEEDNIDIGYSKIERSAYIGRISCKETEEGNIILPSKYNNIVIKELGGYFGRGVPTPFGIDILINPPLSYEEMYTTKEEYIYQSDLNWWDDYEVTTYKYYITLPSKLEKVTYTACKEIFVVTTKEEDNSIFAHIYRPVYHFFIEEENPYFYTEEGKLYNKKTNQLYEEFLYE